MLKIAMDERLIARPRVLCDVCGDSILNSRAACVWYPGRERAEVVDLYLVHKGRCHTRLDDEHRPINGAWMEMIAVPARMAASLGLSIQESEDYARQMAELLGSSML